jgi:UDP-GlcNAc3NAcA epimerase
MKILTVVGARPQFIKAAVVSRAVAGTSGVSEIIVHTGQHYDSNMSDVFFDELAIPKPHHNLGIGSANHGAQTGRMMEQLETVVLNEKPDCVLIYGDTNSTMAGALVAVKLHIPVAHVEAGLRSFNRKMPEEINRVVADHVSNLLFAPTQLAVKNLQTEGIAASAIHLVGDVMYDAALFYGKRSEASKILKTLDLQGGDFILATIHRAENTDDENRLLSIMDAFAQLAGKHKTVLPLHPRTRSKLAPAVVTRLAKAGVLLIDPVGYLDMVALERNCVMVVTDSGGVQKEAFFHGKPCLTLRDETEWVELVEMGWNRLCPPVSKDRIIDSLRAVLGSKGVAGAPYGDGNAGGKIVEILRKTL